MDLHARYPAIADLRRKAKKRIPHFVWEYLDSATGDETTATRNRRALDAILLRPSILHGELTPDLRVTLLGEEMQLPVGIAPVGMSGLIWPEAEIQLAKVAALAGVPYCLSTVATRTPEELAPHLGKHGWFQIYPPRDQTIRRDMIARAQAAGFKTLVLTVDVPVASRRERQTRGGLTQPPRLTGKLALQAAMRPAWLTGIWRTGMPRMKLIDSYSDQSSQLPSTQHAGYLLRTSPDWKYLHKLRDEWEGPLIVKGVLDPRDVRPLEEAGIDGIWISNHAGRQFDAAPATIAVLPAIRQETELPIIIDSGFAGGLDIIRAMALGANFVMMGRAFHYGLAAAGADGSAHVLDIIRKDLQANLGQLGSSDLLDLASRLLNPD